MSITEPTVKRMKTIWKFPLRVDYVQDVTMPEGATILAVQLHQGAPCLWAMVEVGVGSVPRRIRIYGTGHPIDDATAAAGVFLGTFQVADGLRVFHVFEEVPS